MNTKANALVLAAVGGLATLSMAITFWHGPMLATVIAAAAGACTGGVSVLWSRHRRERRYRLALRRRDEHLAYTVHELRSPLTAIINAIEIVRSGYASTPGETLSFLDEADYAARHLSFLVQDVLDRAAMESGQLRFELEDHCVDRLIREGMRVLGLQAARHCIQADVQPELIVHADERRLLQVVFNLVANAAKFSEPGDAIRIVVRPDRRGIRFRVLDQGSGVAASVRNQLFTPFAGDRDNQRADSTGLGLFNCQRLVEGMGGEIGYRPRHPRGSEFWFLLPGRLRHGIAAPRAIAQ